jgi:hypothetical protein
MTPKVIIAADIPGLYGVKRVAVVVLPTIREKGIFANSTLMAIGAERRWKGNVK